MDDTQTAPRRGWNHSLPLRCLQILGWIFCGVVALGAPRSEDVLEFWIQFYLIACPTTFVVGILYLLIMPEDQRVPLFAHIAWMGFCLTIGGLFVFFNMGLIFTSEASPASSAPLWFTLLAFARGLHPPQPRDKPRNHHSQEKVSLFVRSGIAITRGLPSPRVLRAVGWSVSGLVAALSLTNTLPGIVELWRGFYNIAWPVALGIGALPFLFTSRLQSTPFFTTVLWMGLCLAGAQIAVSLFAVFVVALLGVPAFGAVEEWQVPVWITLLAFIRGMYPLERRDSPWPEA